MSEALRVGIVGAGAIAQVAHLPAVSRLRDLQVVGICDNDLAKAHAVAARFQIPTVYEDIEELLPEARPDVVAICTPNHLHEVHVTAALSAGSHVLCERPLAMSAAGVERIRAAAERAGRTVMVGMNHRFRSDVQAVRSFLKSGDLGEVVSVRCGWYMFRPMGQSAGWRQRRRQAGGGAMLDLGVSLLDVSLWLTGCPTPAVVSAVMKPEPTADEVEEAGCALLVCRGGLSIFVDVARRYLGDHERVWLDVVCTKGSASIHPLRIFRELHGSPVNVTPSGAAGREDPFSTSYRSEWAHFFAIVRGAVPRPDLADQVVLHRTLEAVYQSAGQGRAVTS
jgi:predicted dehydrogenase